MSLALKNVSISLGGRRLVNSVNLDLNPGEVVGLLGPNGAGKTTTFNLVIGLLRPDAGQVVMDGRDVETLPMPQRARLGLGYLPQEPSVFRQLSVRENLDVALEQTVLKRSDRIDRRDELIEEFQLSAFVDRRGYQLSGGERRRCEVARALAVGTEGPRYLLLDEPFAGVDPLAVADLQALIQKLRSRGMGILITDHNVRETLASTDRSYILTEGSILASGLSQDVAHDPLVRRYYLGGGFSAVINRIRRATWRRLSLLDRWLLKELVGPLLFFIALFTLLLLTGGVMFELIRKIVDKNLPVGIAAQVLMLSIPRWLAFSVPIGTLMASLFVFTRLSSNSELTALRSLGVTTIRMISAALALSLVMTVFSFVLNDVVVPRSERYAEASLRRALGRSLASETGKDIIYPRFGVRSGAVDEDTRRGLTQLFYARRFEKGEMRDVTVLDFTRAAFTQMLMAEKATWNERQASWDFFDGQILTLNPNGSSTKVGFDRYVYPLGSGPLRLAAVEKDAVNMTVAEALQAERLYLDAGSIKDARKIQVRIQEKFTVPLTCLVFGLFGATLGCLPSYRTSRSFSFVLALGIICVYYVVGFSFSSLGVRGTMPPVLAAWMPLLLSLGGGGLLLRQASR